MEDITNAVTAILNEESCYPEKERKPRELREKELLEWYDNYGEINSWYNVYGMDLIESDPLNMWLDSGIFVKERYQVNSQYYPFGSQYPYNYTLFMRDKYAFEMLMRSLYGQRQVYCRSEAILRNKQIYNNSLVNGLVKISNTAFLKQYEGHKLVFKNSFGYGGDGIKIVNVVNKQIFSLSDSITYGFEDFIDSLIKVSGTDSVWLIQEYLKQHPVMNQLNSTSVNTIRVITFHTGDEIIASKAVVRYGKKGSLVDNSGRGGYFTSIDENGNLSDYVFDYGEKKRIKNVNNKLEIPYYKDAIQLAINTHKLIPQLFTIGWDIVICENSPMILEGNDGWGTHISQAPAGYALRSMWENLLHKRCEFYNNSSYK